MSDTITATVGRKKAAENTSKNLVSDRTFGPRGGLCAPQDYVRGRKCLGEISQLHFQISRPPTLFLFVGISSQTSTVAANPFSSVSSAFSPSDATTRSAARCHPARYSSL